MFLVCAWLGLLRACQEKEGNADTPIMSLRSALQRIEASGMVDYTLGGHTCARPQAVQQGKVDDCFSVSPDGSARLLWRPNTVPGKQLKVASSFSYTSLNASPLVLVLWQVCSSISAYSSSFVTR